MGSACTVAWKIFVWNYFIVKIIQEKIFHGYPVHTLSTAYQLPLKPLVWHSWRPFEVSAQDQTS